MTDMERRGFIEFVGGIGFGALAGYYAGARELLGIQNTDHREPSQVPENGGDSTQSTPRPTEGDEGSTQSTQTVENKEDTTRRPETQTTQLLSLPFTEEFQNGMQGWSVNQRFRTGSQRRPSNPPAGDGGYSDKYSGSVRLHVDGSGSTIGVAHPTQTLPKGTQFTVTYRVSTSTPQPGKVGIAIFAPDGDDNEETVVASTNGKVTSGTNTITGTISQTYPANSELRIFADVWPGEYTAHITTIRARQGDTKSNKFSFEQASAGDSLPAGEWYLMADEGSHTISTRTATHGEQSLRLQGGRGLGETRVAINMDFTPINEIRFDGYVIQNNTYAGDIKVHVDDTNGKIGGMTQKDQETWHHDLGGQNQVAEFSGEHTLILRTRGAENEAFFDNIRLFGESGEMIPPDQVI